MNYTMASGSLIATLGSSQWTVRDAASNTVAWISPASRALWMVSAWGPFSRGTYGFTSARVAFEAVCEELGDAHQGCMHAMNTHPASQPSGPGACKRNATPRTWTT